uniref:Uncharacterized protein n=1 Tax=Magallana gigas TaxID=29159 RepID=A0A8W8IKV5_MAGGI
MSATHHTNTTTVVMAAPQPTVVIQQPKRERFADKILLNLIISFFFPFWLFVWCCMCICEK